MKTIAFFGDSFVGQYIGWLEYFCEVFEYQCLSVGKPGGDFIYSFMKWKEMNETHQEKVDVCVFAHTEGSRLFHPDKDIAITFAIANDHEKVVNLRQEKQISSLEKKQLNAAQSYYEYLYFREADNIKNILYPLGIDRFMKENNKTFKKIIHLWSFSPIQPGSFEDRLGKSRWPFSIQSGMNVKLCLKSLSELDPFNKFEEWDQRPLHFSIEHNQFISDILYTGIEKYQKKELNFEHYVGKNPTWQNYCKALEKIKKA